MKPHTIFGKYILLNARPWEGNGCQYGPWQSAWQLCSFHIWPTQIDWKSHSCRVRWGLRRICPRTDNCWSRSLSKKPNSFMRHPTSSFFEAAVKRRPKNQLHSTTESVLRGPKQQQKMYILLLQLKPQTVHWKVMSCGNSHQPWAAVGWTFFATTLSEFGLAATRFVKRNWLTYSSVASTWLFGKAQVFHGNPVVEQQPGFVFTFEVIVVCARLFLRVFVSKLATASLLPFLIHCPDVHSCLWNRNHCVFKNQPATYATLSSTKTTPCSSANIGIFQNKETQGIKTATDAILHI